MKIEIGVGDTVEVVNRNDKWNGKVYNVLSVPSERVGNKFIDVDNGDDDLVASFVPNQLKVIAKATNLSSGIPFSIGSTVALRNRPDSLWTVIGHDYRRTYVEGDDYATRDVVLLNRLGKDWGECWDYPDNLIPYEECPFEFGSLVRNIDFPWIRHTVTGWTYYDGQVVKSWVFLDEDGVKQFAHRYELMDAPEPSEGSVVVAADKAYIRWSGYWFTPDTPAGLTWTSVLKIEKNPLVIWDAE